MINVTATGNNTGIIENCYGKPGHTPALQTPHVVGKDCPPAPDEFSVRKVCNLAVLAANGPSFIANCRITVGTLGQFPAGYSVQELLSGSNGEINFVGSTPAEL